MSCVVQSQITDKDSVLFLNQTCAIISIKGPQSLVCTRTWLELTTLLPIKDKDTGMCGTFIILDYT